MHVVFVSLCQGKALKRTRAVLDRYALRAGVGTWMTPMTTEALESVLQALRVQASRHTAVACYQNEGRTRMALLWTVGRAGVFGPHGEIALHQRTVPRAPDPGWLRRLKTMAVLEGLSHDFGKASAHFQGKLRQALPVADGIRHEFLSWHLLEALCALPVFEAARTQAEARGAAREQAGWCEGESTGKEGRGVDGGGKREAADWHTSSLEGDGGRDLFPKKGTEKAVATGGDAAEEGVEGAEEEHIRLTPDAAWACWVAAWDAVARLDRAAPEGRGVLSMGNSLHAWPEHFVERQGTERNAAGHRKQVEARFQVCTTWQQAVGMAVATHHGVFGKRPGYGENRPSTSDVLAVTPLGSHTARVFPERADTSSGTQKGHTLTEAERYLPYVTLSTRWSEDEKRAMSRVIQRVFRVWQRLWEHPVPLQRRTHGWRAEAFVTRAALILADHEVSAWRRPAREQVAAQTDREPCQERGGVERATADPSSLQTRSHREGRAQVQAGVFANTDRRSLEERGGQTAFLNQRLPFHLAHVGQRAQQWVTQFFEPRLPGLAAETRRRLVLEVPPARLAERFAWQGVATQGLACATEERACPTLVFNVAGTGAGKTRMNMKALVALTPENQPVRVAAGFNLKTLTLQTREAFVHELGLRPQEVACLVGDAVAVALHAQQKTQRQEASYQALSLDDENMDAEGESFLVKTTRTPGGEHPRTEPDAVTYTVVGDVATTGPAWLTDLPSGTRGGHVRELIGAPVLVSTMDYLIKAGEPGEQGHHGRALLRLASSDLLLDEVDAYEPRALTAVLRLVYLAGVFERHVVASSATLPLPLVTALTRTYLTGLQAGACLRERTVVAWRCAVIDDAVGEDALHYKTFVQPLGELLMKQEQGDVTVTTQATREDGERRQEAYPETLEGMTQTVELLYRMCMQKKVQRLVDGEKAGRVVRRARIVDWVPPEVRRGDLSSQDTLLKDTSSQRVAVPIQRSAVQQKNAVPAFQKGSARTREQPLTKRTVQEVLPFLLERLATSLGELHRDLGWEARLPSGDTRRVSLGLVRLANVAPCVHVAQGLVQRAEAFQREGLTVYVCPYHAADVTIRRAYKERILDSLLTRKATQETWIQRLLADPETRKALEQATTEHVVFVVVATPVEEIGRDHDFDWGILEPSSSAALIQGAGRINRHRLTPLPPGKCNLHLLRQNLRWARGERSVFTRPGCEEGAEGAYPSQDLVRLLAPPPLQTQAGLLVQGAGTIAPEVPLYVLDARLRFAEQPAWFSVLDEARITQELAFPCHILTSGGVQKKVKGSARHPSSLQHGAQGPSDTRSEGTWWSTLFYHAFPLRERERKVTWCLQVEAEGDAQKGGVRTSPQGETWRIARQELKKTAQGYLWVWEGVEVPAHVGEEAFLSHPCWWLSPPCTALPELAQRFLGKTIPVLQKQALMWTTPSYGVRDTPSGVQAWPGFHPRAGGYT